MAFQFHRRSLVRTSFLLLLVGCQSSKKDDVGPYSPYAPDAGSALRTDPLEGTRYLTSVGLPGVGAVYLPDWVVNPSLDGVLGAVGVAAPNDLGTSHQVEGARTSARLELARMLEVRVQEVGRRDIDQHLRVGDEGSIEDQGSRKSLLGVDRNISDLVLAGSRQRALWFDPNSGDCYAWIVMDGSIQSKADHYVENGVSVYVANQVIDTEFRPQRPQPEPAPAPEAPQQPTDPLDRLESNLDPIETIPVRPYGEGPR